MANKIFQETATDDTKIQDTELQDITMNNKMDLIER